MVEGRFLFGFILISMAAVIFVVILGLRDLDGTLWGPEATNTVILSVVFVGFVLVASLLSFTNLLRRS
jgi:hypothetical protein